MNQQIFNGIVWSVCRQSDNNEDCLNVRERMNHSHKEIMNYNGRIRPVVDRVKQFVFIS